MKRSLSEIVAELEARNARLGPRGSTLVKHATLERLCAAVRCAASLREWIQPLAPDVDVRGAGSLGCGWMDEWELIEVHKAIAAWDAIAGGSDE